MNNNPEKASTWKGRILMHYEAYDTKEPLMMIQPISQERKAEAAVWTTTQKFQIIAEIGAGIHLPDSKKYKVKISFGDIMLQTDNPAETKQNYCRWNKRFDSHVV